MSIELQTLSGTVSSSRIVSQSEIGYGGEINYHTSMFKVDGFPVEMRGSYNISDGDAVSVSGIRNPTGFKALALRDHATGIIWGAQVDERDRRIGSIFLVIGLVTLIGFVGLVPIAIGVHYLRKSNFAHKQVLAAKEILAGSSFEVGSGAGQ